MGQSSARRLRRGLQAFGIAAAGSAFLLLGFLIAEISRLPSVHSLLVYLPDQAGELPPQLCIEQSVQAVPISSALPLKPALLAAEGTHGHYSGQIARTLMCNSHRTNLRRDLDELLLAVEIDHSFSLDQRLTIYLNRLYLGEGQVGVAAASRHYFGKTVDQLSLPDRALLTGMAKSPAYFAPARHPDRALERRNSGLIGMVQQGSVSTAEGTAAEASPLPVSQ